MGDGLLEQVRIAQNRPDAVRVVLDFKGVWEHNFFYLDAPPRLVIDVKGQAELRPSRRRPTPAREAAREAPPGASAGGTTGRRPGRPPHRRRSPAGPPRPSGPGRDASRARTLPAPEPPAANRAGTYSLARQLGLGARRIVIDPGHGGHDPGTIGRKGLQEKDLVLDVSLRLARAGRARSSAPRW